jgi:hypothetical protein
MVGCALAVWGAMGETNPPAVDAALSALIERVQEQHKTTMWFLDQLRQSLEDTSREKDLAIAGAVHRLEETLATQARQDSEWIERAHRLTIVTAGCIGGLALVVMVAAVAGMYRALGRRIEPVGLSVSPGAFGDADQFGSQATVAVREARLVSADLADRRLLLAIERLERRVAEMEKQATGASGVHWR